MEKAFGADLVCWALSMPVSHVNVLHSKAISISMLSEWNSAEQKGMERQMLGLQVVRGDNM